MSDWKLMVLVAMLVPWLHAIEILRRQGRERLVLDPSEHDGQCRTGIPCVHILRRKIALWDNRRQIRARRVSAARVGKGLAARSQRTEHGDQYTDSLFHHERSPVRDCWISISLLATPSQSHEAEQSHAQECHAGRLGNIQIDVRRASGPERIRCGVGNPGQAAVDRQFSEHIEEAIDGNSRCRPAESRFAPATVASGFPGSHRRRPSVPVSIICDHFHREISRLTRDGSAVGIRIHWTLQWQLEKNRAGRGRRDPPWPLNPDSK